MSHTSSSWGEGGLAEVEGRWQEGRDRSRETRNNMGRGGAEGTMQARQALHNQACGLCLKFSI